MRSVFLLKVLGMALLALVSFLSFPQAIPAMKVRYVTPAVSEPYQLPLIAAEDQGVWKKYGLAVEWIQLRGDATFMKALTADMVDAGTTNTIGAVWAVARGVPLMITASVSRGEFFVWVRGDSAMRVPSDLKGKKIGVTSLGGTIHAYGQAAVKALGLEKDVKFVATGGPRESVAALKAGTIDGVVSSLRSVIRLKLAGEVREVVTIENYLPRERADVVSVAHRRLVFDEPSTVRALATALVEALRFLRANPAWLIDKMKAEFGYSDQAAKVILEKKGFVISADGSLSRREIENVSEFVVQYGLIPKGALPPLEQYFAPIFPR